MPTTEQISEVLGEIQDPELHRGLNELNMVRNIAIEGSQVDGPDRPDDPGLPPEGLLPQRHPGQAERDLPGRSPTSRSSSPR